MTIFAIRAMGLDPVGQRLAERIEAMTGQRPVFVCDARNGPAQTGDYRQISMTNESLGMLGFQNLPPDWGWFCGDMCYYSLADAFPDETSFCLIESDVYLTATALDPLAKALDHPAEALAVHLKQHDEPKKYSRGLDALELDARWGCIFPISRVTRNVITKMKALRQDVITKIPQARINDEAILAGAVQKHGLSHADLAQIAPTLFAPDSYDTNPPHLYEGVVHLNVPKIFHPAVDFDTVTRRIRSGEKAYSKHRLRRVLAEAPKDMKKAIKTLLNEG